MKEIQKKGLSIAAAAFGVLWILVLSEIGAPAYAEGQVGVPWNWWGFIGLTGVCMLYAGCSFLIYRLSVVEHLALVEFTVLGDLLGVDVTVVIQDRSVLGVIVEQLSGRGGGE